MTFELTEHEMNHYEFLSAVREGKTQEAIDLVKKGFCDDASLRQAASFNNLEVVKCMVSKNPDMYKVGALICAASNGNIEIVQYLLDNGTPINEKLEELGYIALGEAAYAGNFEMVEFLLKKGANIDEKDSNGNTALMRAIRAANLKMVKYLVDRKADINWEKVSTCIINTFFPKDKLNDLNDLNSIFLRDCEKYLEANNIGIFWDDINCYVTMVKEKAGAEKAKEVLGILKDYEKTYIRDKLLENRNSRKTRVVEEKIVQEGEKIELVKL